MVDLAQYAFPAFHLPGQALAVIAGGVATAGIEAAFLMNHREDR